MTRSYLFPAMLLVGLGTGLGLACGGVGDLTIQGTGSGGGASSTTTGSGGGSGATGVPCDVAAALTVCISCHTNPPIAGAVGSLVTYADLTAVAPADPLQQPTAGDTMAQMAVVRMKDTARPMPPAGTTPPTAAQIQAVQDWVNAGTPMGTCTADAGVPDPTFTGPSVCASGKYDHFTGDGSSTMTPGEACIACHSTNDGPSLSVGGTLFATGHVPDDCLPTSTQSAELTQAKVVITDANMQVVTLSVTSSGDFYRRSSSVPKLTFPITAKVTYQGKERAMLAAQTSGDCNVCHTDQGAQNAPGRIALPE